MSILQDFEMVRKELGENKWNKLDIYCTSQNIRLDEVIYSREQWLQFEEWLSSQNTKEE